MARFRLFLDLRLLSPLIGSISGHSRSSSALLSWNRLVRSFESGYRLFPLPSRSHHSYGPTRYGAGSEYASRSGIIRIIFLRSSKGESVRK